MNVLNKLSFLFTMALFIVIPSVLLLALPWWLLVMCVALLMGWMALTRTGQQAWSVAKIGIVTIPQRLGASTVVVVGIAGVVGVSVALLSMGAGFEATLKRTGTDDTAIVVSAGSRSEGGSNLDAQAVAVVSQAEQVIKNEQGRPLASPELSVLTSLRKKSGPDANVGIRGVGEQAWVLRPRVQVVAGRKFEPGLYELLVGKGVHEQFAQTDIGAKLTINGQLWTVVGVFDSGDLHNSEMWADTAVVGSAFRRGSGKTAVTVKLTEPQAIDAFKAALASDPRLKVDVQTTRQFYGKQSEELTKMTRILGVTVGAIMAVGALFGALNTMYAAIATRGREIATLRAIGFLQAPVIISVMLETMLLATLGGVLGAAIAWAVFDGFTASTLGASGQVMFAFSVSPALLWNGVKWALAIGLIGGIFPAMRAAHMPIVSGLREL